MTSPSSRWSCFLAASSHVYSAPVSWGSVLCLSYHLFPVPHRQPFLQPFGPINSIFPSPTSHQTSAQSCPLQHCPRPGNRWRQSVSVCRTPHIVFFFVFLNNSSCRDWAFSRGCPATHNRFLQEDSFLSHRHMEKYRY